ncbi:hypothetical protein [Salinispira pacifica]
MQSIRIVEVEGRRQEAAFIDLPAALYRGSSCWVPWFATDMRTILRRRHPFFEHSPGAFFLAVVKGDDLPAGTLPDGLPTLAGDKGGMIAGRICVVANRRYNDSHGTATAHFYFVDFVDDEAVARALFDAAAEWAGRQGCNELAGPMLFGGATGSGILVQGFEHRAAMTMMGYNYPYYERLVVSAGFEKQLDLYSLRLEPATFRMDERVVSVAEKVLKRGRFSVLRFGSKRALMKRAPEIAALYNDTLADHTEGYPLTEAELEQVTKDLALVGQADLIKILTYDGGIIGFLFGFPDLTAALQRSKGRITPLSIIDILLEFRRTNQLIVNGAGILPRYQRLGGNALLYYELERTVRSRTGRRAFVHADLTQIAETTELMLSDMQRIGAEVYKVHRTYRRAI